MSKNLIKIIHLSDIHFYEADDGKLNHHRHSLRCMKQIEPILEKEKPDYIIVTGDITNIGDTPSYNRVYQWLHDKIYASGDYYGLGAIEKGIKLIVVPGNHDAFNAPSHGRVWKRWQSALDNYREAFAEYDFNEKGVNHQWIKKGENHLFVCCVDSCYMGEDETENRPGALKLDKIAKGKISRSQSEEILSVYDDGIMGNLKDEDGLPISRDDFLSSLKVLVMHHYLFEPSATKVEPLLHVDDKKTVFQNIAMSEFDILLCGHKHIADFGMSVYMDHFDPRGKLRYAINHVRRILGVKSLPLRIDNEGRPQNKMYRFILNLLYQSKARTGSMNDETVLEIISLLERALENPRVLTDELMKYVKTRKEYIDGNLFEKDEIINLHRTIMKHFKGDKKKELMFAANTLKGSVAKLAGRPFAQIMSGSSAKSSEKGTRNRSFNIYEITSSDVDKKYVWKTKRYSWNEHEKCPDGSKGKFSNRPLVQETEFPFDRIENLF